jgi:small subunit ribosomal protein S16
MLRIRLTRVGKKKQPHYRVVVADIEAPRDGRIVERIGYYSPLTESDLMDIDEERALYWLSVGAQPTDTVRSLLRKRGTLERFARMRAGEPLDAVVTAYKQETGEIEPEAEAQEEPVAEAEEVDEETAVEAEETVVEEPETEVAEAYAEAEAETETTEELVETVDEAVDTVADSATDALDAVAEAVQEVVGAEEEE